MCGSRQFEAGLIVLASNRPRAGRPSSPPRHEARNRACILAYVYARQYVADAIDCDKRTKGHDATMPLDRSDSPLPAMVFSPPPRMQ